MPRPKKCRSVCALPQTVFFSPEGPSESAQAVILTVEEYETIRLIDKEGLSQEQCSQRMQVARTTVQQIYADARKKLAEVLAAGKLDFDPNIRCDHHDHHGEGHSCGSHGCGHHSCG